MPDPARSAGTAHDVAAARYRAADSPGVSGADEQLIERHISWFRRNGATPASIVSRTDNIRRVAEALPVQLLDATPDDLEHWQAELLGRPGQRGRATLAPATLATYTAHVRSFYRWCVESDLIEVDPSRRLPRPRPPKARARPIPQDDLRAVLAVAPEPLRTWLLLACFMGFRAMDVAACSGGSLSEVGGRLVLAGIGKGGVPFQMIVPRHVEPALRPYQRVRGRWWTTPRGCPLTPAHVSQLVSAFFKRQGMDYTFHQARHSFGTSLYAETKDLLLTQEAMRHSSPTTTRIYVGTSSAAAVAAADDLAGRMLGGGRR